MKLVELLKKRRSVYALNKQISLNDEQLLKLVEDVTENVPDAFNALSQRVVLVTGENNQKLWDTIHDSFDGMVKKEKTDSFASGYGTILFFIDSSKVKELQEKFPLYKDKFPIYANQSNAMLQHAIWVALADEGIGASLQHYQPVVNENVRKLFNLPEEWDLNAQMPFGGIAQAPAAKPTANIKDRVFAK